MSETASNRIMAGEGPSFSRVHFWSLIRSLVRSLSVVSLRRARPADDKGRPQDGAGAAVGAGALPDGGPRGGGGGGHAEAAARLHLRGALHGALRL
eukprot:1051794-Prorocentrum_minimum.AAC.1